MKATTNLIFRKASSYGSWWSVAKWILGFGILMVLPFITQIEIFGFSLFVIISLKVLILTLIWAYAGQAWNIMSGFTGYFSFGHAAFFGIGAYATQKLLVDYLVNPWIGMLIGGLIAMLFGLLLGYLNFRYNLRGHYFALATFAFSLLVMSSVRNIQELNGALGYTRPLPNQYASGYGLLAFQFKNDLPYYFVILSLFLVLTVIVYLIRHSQVGLYMFAIREDEDAAKSLGIPAFRYKMFGIGTSAFFVAWAGTFWSMYFNTINPDTVFQLQTNILILLPTVVGGLGTTVGSVVGSFLVIPLARIFRNYFTQIVGIDILIYGIAIILFGIFLPRGILSLSFFKD